MASIPATMISSSDGPRPMPVIGMGTAIPMEDSKVALSTILLEAMKVGYRHFDSAEVYQTEKPLGEAIKEALRLGIIKSRAELFITTKLWCNKTEQHLVLPAIKNSLKTLGLEYLDLYLIHFPIKLNEEQFKIPFPKVGISPIDVRAVWEAMEECQNLGFTKSIGISNFSIQRTQQVLSVAKIPPVVNQVEMNPVWHQKKLNEFCKEKGIHIMAYSPLGGFGNRKLGHNRVMESDVLKDIAKSNRKTISQISLRWLYEQGVSVAVKSLNTERMKQNLDIFDWSLTEEELNKISQIPQYRHVYLTGMLAIEHNDDVLAEIDAELDQ